MTPTPNTAGETSSMGTPWTDRWVSPCGRATLLLGDCLDILPLFEPKPAAQQHLFSEAAP